MVEETADGSFTDLAEVLLRYPRPLHEQYSALSQQERVCFGAEPGDGSGVRPSQGIGVREEFLEHPMSEDT
ncbi:hypothetical protein D3C84_968560 [compost metagenome]